MANIAFIGLGNMGKEMARHLLAAGHALTVYARRMEAAAPLEVRVDKISKGVIADLTETTDRPAFPGRTGLAGLAGKTNAPH